MAAEEELRRLTFGERIRYVQREMLRINQAAFATRVGVSVRTVKRWEASFIAPSRDKAAKIAELANVASELFYPDDAVEPDPIIEVRQMIANMEKMLVTVTREMLETLQEMTGQLERQTDLLALLEAKVDEPPRAAPARRTRKRSAG